MSDQNEGVEVKTAETTPDVDTLAKKILDAATHSTKKNSPFEHRLVVPTATMEDLMVGQGVSKESLRNFNDALGTTYRALHHATALKLRDELKNTKGDDRDKISVDARGDISAKSLRLRVNLRAKVSGTSVARPGHPATPYTNYGHSHCKITLDTQLNDQRERDAKLVREAFEDNA